MKGRADEPVFEKCSMEKNLDLGNQPSLKQSVYDTLHRMIIHGELKPGERITEEELSKSMNISRAPIREGLSMLERDGFVEIVPRKGVTVSPVTDKLVDNIWGCRIALEPAAARESIHNIPREEAEKVLEELNGLLESGTVNPDKYIASDLNVHGLYFKYLDNEMMQSILANLRQHSIRARWIKEQRNPDPEDFVVSTKEHIEIVKAIIAQDGEAAYEAVFRHIANSRERVRASV